MENSEIQHLAIALEDEELVGEDGRLLGAEDIAVVIEALWTRGAEFDRLLEGEVSDDQPDSEALGAVTQE